MKNEKRALGRGLSALISGNNAFKMEATEEIENTNTAQDVDLINKNSLKFVSIDKITSNSEQPRKVFLEEDLQELANSIKSLGVLQPILVRKQGDNYQIIAGERRWRASQIAGLTEVPVVEKDLSDQKTLEAALVENIQRQDLTPIEEAKAYEKLMNEFNLTQEKLSEVSGKSRAAVANSVRLLKLPQLVQDLVESGKISTGHAKCILSVKEPQVQISLAKKVSDEGLSVRALEEIVSGTVMLGGKKLSSKSINHSNVSALPDTEERLRRSLSTKVFLHHTTSGKGYIKVEYFSEEELERIVEKICG